MNARLVPYTLCGALLGLMLTGCATKPYDYTNYRAHPPRSILVLPPLNESKDVRGTYGYYTTVTMPLAEKGYYVYPVAVVDQFFKANGLPTAGEMHQAPLSKIRAVFGADAVLYLTVKEYGSEYVVISSVTAVTVAGRLVDTQTGTVLWEGTVMASQNTGGSGGLADLIFALIGQIVSSTTDNAHQLSGFANTQFAVKDHGLLYGPYHPKYGSD
jgi:hypothetical protein